MYAGIAEVMSLVTNLGSGEEAGKEELSGPTDPIRVVMSHTINPAARTVGFTVELLNRMTADVKSLVLRSVLYSKNPLCQSQSLFHVKTTQCSAVSNSCYSVELCILYKMVVCSDISHPLICTMAFNSWMANGETIYYLYSLDADPIKLFSCV